MTIPEVMIGEIPSSMSVPRLEARITRIQYLHACGAAGLLSSKTNGAGGTQFSRVCERAYPLYPR